MSTSIIETIIDREWEMFVHVNGNVLSASCQTKPDKFRSMRKAQFMAWPKDALEQYTADLADAEKEGRNLLREKYIYMMETTASTVQWEMLEKELPPCSEKKMKLVDEICAIMMEDTKKFRETYPNLSDAGRPLYKEEDTPVVTSLETYERGELRTYSEKTLELLRAHIEELRKAGTSFSEEIQRQTFSVYGFSTLQEADDYIKDKKAQTLT